ncbi:MAG TPA: SelB C-terminal domain-containing protein [Nocardioidaceae bacterium]|nr:SelB C-terminal domain-containing protein [Nocardioidaceae bacterium]
MHVIATAGHVDHGKSTLVRALTGSDPDRLEEEHRRGLSIELGYVWTSLGSVGDVAFVDVPGHERFISTMLAGIGPVPAVLLVVAADDPWMPQAAEHLAALDALGVSYGVVAVSRSDLADPGPAVARARAELAGTSLRGAPVVPVSAHTGEGLQRLRARLVEMVAALPTPDPAEDVRLWVDRRFTIKGAGTVVTGTLPAGTVRVGDTLSSGRATLRVRGVQSLGRAVDSAAGVARVALNLTGDVVDLDRGSVLVAPGAWHRTDALDVRVTSRQGTPPPERPLLHIGATSVATHCRPLSDDLVRLRLDHPLPLRIGDRALLRDPGSRQVWGVSVLDPAPPPLRRRGAATLRAKALTGVVGPDLADEVARRGIVAVEQLRRIGVPVDDRSLEAAAVVAADGWLVSDERADAAAAEVQAVVAEQERTAPLDRGVPLSVLAERVGLPSVELVRAVVRPPLRVESGRVTSGRSVVLPEGLQRAVEAVREDLAADPFAAPTADRLREVGLDNKGAAAAAKAGLLLRPAPGIVLLPDADRLAAAWLSELPQPFTTSEARVRLGTSRRVVLPLLEHLDRVGLTRRLPDDRREVTGA